MALKFRVRETMPCWVTWTRIVEVPADVPDDEAAAWALSNASDIAAPTGDPEIGDSIDGLGDDIVAEEISKSEP